MDTDKIKDLVEIPVFCRICGTKHVLSVSAEGFRKWRNGELVQKCFPNMSRNLRELLISRTCPECWDKMFGEGDYGIEIEDPGHIREN